MKVTGNQRSILSFFGAPKASQGNDTKTASSEDKKAKIVNDDSPVKKANRRSRVIESDSEDEEKIKVEPEKSCEDKENSSNNVDLSSPDDSIACSSTTSKNKIGFSAETVPPLRKTARKQMKRKSDALEDHQKEVVKKLKSSPPAKSPVKKLKSSPPAKSPVKKLKSSPPAKSPVSKKVQAENKSGTPKANGHKRTNCLDMFVFKKTPRNSEPDSDLKETSSKVHETSNKEEHMGKDSLKKLSNNDTESTTKEDSDNNDENTSNKGSKADTKSTSNKNSDNSATSNISTSKLEEDEEMEVDDSSESIETDSQSKEKIASSDDIKTPKKSESSFESSMCESSPTLKKKPDSKVKKSPKTELKNPFNQVKEDKIKSNEFDPSKTKYDPLEDASWKRNEEVPFFALSKTFKIIEETSGRLKTIEILSNFLRSVIILSPNDFLYCIYLCLSKVAPSFEGIELGIGEIYVCRAVAQVTGRAVNMIKNEISEKGDLGLVAEQSKSNQRMMFQPAPLTVKKVFNNLKEIALMSGQSSQNKKIDKIKSMFVACKGSEARFLIRLCGGKLRIGLAEQSVLQAIAQACFLTPPGQEFPPEILNAGKGLSADNFKSKVDEFANILKTTYCECPTFDSIVPVLLEKGMTELPNYCKLEPGIPLKPMLAHPTKGVSEVLKRFDKSKFTCEYKYDGERAQIHLKEDGTVNIFSRNQENNTTKYPDIIARLKNSLGADVKSCVLDSEAVAFDVNEKKILPFQILSTRKRKDVNESEIKVQVCLFPFDLLYLNGRNLVTEPFQARRDLLHANFIEKEGQFTFAKSIDSTNTEDIEEFLEESIKGNCEGLMVKSLDVDATYEIAKRSRNWLKLKKDYLEGVGDTIDVVVIGGYSGKGKRMGTYGGFLIACYDPDNEEFQSLCKIGTGFSDESLQQHTTFLKEHVIENPKSYYRYDSTLKPDFWFDAVQVWEIKCADLSISPVHKAAIGIVDPEKGISLRFPRFLRIRDDKSPEDATSASQIADLYRNQEQIKNQTDNNCEEDFY